MQAVQQMLLQLRGNPHYPFASEFEKNLASVIKGSGMTIEHTNKLLDLLGEKIELNLKSFKDIEKRLQDLPVQVRFHSCH